MYTYMFIRWNQFTTFFVHILKTEGKARYPFTSAKQLLYSLII